MTHTASERLESLHHAIGTAERLIRDTRRTIANIEFGTRHAPGHRPALAARLEKLRTALAAQRDLRAEIEAEAADAQAEHLKAVEQAAAPLAVARAVAAILPVWACRCATEYPAPSLRSYAHELLDDLLREHGHRAAEDPQLLSGLRRKLADRYAI